MELSNNELRIILDALFDKMSDDDLPAEEMKQVLYLHNKIGAKLFNL